LTRTQKEVGARDVQKYIRPSASSESTKGETKKMILDALYAYFKRIIVVLPEDARFWSITLCFSFFSMLSTNFRDKIEKEDTF